jgi:hypothetical protein
MAILRNHVPYFAEIVRLPGFLTDPVLTFGYQEVYIDATRYLAWHEIDTKLKIKKARRYFVEKGEAFFGKRHRDLHIPRQMLEKDLKGVLTNYGMKDLTVLDFEDFRADVRHDMNIPIPDHLRSKFNTIIDIGSLEHVFDTKRCLENLFSMLKVNGHILLHTPCKGCFDHGLHTFSPECILASLKFNGFEIRYVAYSTESGLPLAAPGNGRDVIIWVVARKVGEMKVFVVPQQGRWQEKYAWQKSELPASV